MDTETAIETRIKPQLIDAFGRRVANSLLTLATVSYATTNGDEREKYRAFVHSICSDDRVISTWGERGVARQKEEWEALVTAVQVRPAPGFGGQ
ncbi:MAG: hypothetical protein H8D43_00690 [Chloroflexi bacterium]|nr:hypothetical protein [Chloroflexota bacterium]